MPANKISPTGPRRGRVLWFHSEWLLLGQLHSLPGLVSWSSGIPLSWCTFSSCWSISSNRFLRRQAREEKTELFPYPNTSFHIWQVIEQVYNSTQTSFSFRILKLFYRSLCYFKKMYIVQGLDSLCMIHFFLYICFLKKSLLLSVELWNTLMTFLGAGNNFLFFCAGLFQVEINIPQFWEVVQYSLKSPSILLCFLFPDL